MSGDTDEWAECAQVYQTLAVLLGFLLDIWTIVGSAQILEEGYGVSLTCPQKQYCRYVK